MFRRVFMFVRGAGRRVDSRRGARRRPRGTIGGVVRDSSGGAIPGATIRVVNEATGAALEAVSDAQGAYRVDDSRPGSIASRRRSTASSRRCAAVPSTGVRRRRST